MISKKVVVILCVIILVISGVTVFAGKGGVKSMREYAEKRSTIPEGGEVVATVNDDKIYKSSVDKKMLYYEYSLYVNSTQSDSGEYVKQESVDSKTAKEMVMDMLIKDQLKRQLCQKYNLTVSDDEARACMDREFSALKQQLESDNESIRKNAQQFYEQIEEYKAGAKMTDEQYEAYCIDGYRTLLLGNKLYEYASEHNLLNNNVESSYERFQDYLESVKAESDIVIK